MTCKWILENIICASYPRNIVVKSSQLCHIETMHVANRWESPLRLLWIY
jgi:hypothetical protein